MKNPKKTPHVTRQLRSVNVLILNDQFATVAHATVARENLETGQVLVYEATGSTKREPGDVRDDGIAVNLAMGRALENLGLALQQDGMDRVEAATLAQKVEFAERVLRRIQREAPAGTVLTIEEIRTEWGDEAAERAAARRARKDGKGPGKKKTKGRHEKP